jgi:hypothetical protein
MAHFVEFLKSGMSAKEFIDTAVLPQHVIPVKQTDFSPEPYEKEDKAVDMEGETGQQLIEGDDDADPNFLAALEAAEEKTES